MTVTDMPIYHPLDVDLAVQALAHAFGRTWFPRVWAWDAWRGLGLEPDLTNGDLEMTWNKVVRRHLIKRIWKPGDRRHRRYMYRLKR